MSCTLSFGRRRIQQLQLVKGPNRILLTLEDLSFINPQLSKRVHCDSLTLNVARLHCKLQKLLLKDFQIAIQLHCSCAIRMEFQLNVTSY